MAALTPAHVELANSLTLDELPTKLRCAICSKLAVNAFRLPCCETAICESCQSTLPSSCPVCEHSPVSGADCTVYKSLRTTIKVFLKTEEKKREAARPKTNGSAPSTPIEATPTPLLSKAPAEPPVTDAPAPAQDGIVTDEFMENRPSVRTESQENGTATPEEGHPQPDQDNHSADQSGDQNGNNDQSQAVVANGQDDAENQQVENANEGSQEAEGDDASGQQGIGFGADGMNPAFHMNFGGGEMNQMQMMLTMQNGMNQAGFGSFPMMGMGMGMDPMAMQNMYMSGGFGAQGMGMSGMNMNMGMNGFNGGSNDWNGQQSWNVGQDNFNPNAGSMGNDDFGNFNSGFRTGYNSGNYAHPNQYNDYGRGGYGYRGRGRGRGFYNRGYGRGYHQGYTPRQYGQENWRQQIANYCGNDAQPNGPESSGPTGEQQKSANVDEFGRTIRKDDANQEDQSQVQTGNAENGRGSGDSSHADTSAVKLLSHESTGQVPSENAPQTGEAHDDTAMNNGDVSSANTYSKPRGLSQGTAVPELPLNAPTGPKAMRQGLPNTSALHLRARGFMADERSPISGSNKSIVESPIEEEEQQSGSRSSSRPMDSDGHRGERGRDGDVAQKETQHRERGYDGDYNRSRSPSRSRSRSSRSRDGKESHRHRRHRSESMSDDERDDEYRRRKHRSRRTMRDDDDYKSRSRDDGCEDKSRSASPAEVRDRDREHRRSSHRSHRDSEHDRRRKSSHRSHHDHEHDRDRERDRDRDRNRDRDRDRDRERNKERNRDKDRDRENKERDRDGGKNTTRDRDRDRDRDRENRHRSHKTSTEARTPVESSEKDFIPKPPTGPRRGNGSISINIKGTGLSKPGGGFEIKGASSKSSNNSSSHHREGGESSSRRPSQASIGGGHHQKSASSGPTKDPHTLEREARDRERLLKEAQRMAGLAGKASLKRSRDAGDDRAGGRRKSRRSDAVYGDEEDRMRRLEAEREAARWD